MKSRAARLVAITLVSALLATSCTSFRPVHPETISATLKKGDTVKVVTKDGREAKFEISDIAPDAIRRQTEVVRVADIETLERREYDRAKTSLLVIPLAIVAFRVVRLSRDV